MAPAIRVKIDGKEHQVETRRITLICPSASMAAHKIEYPDAMEITPEGTIYHAERVDKLHDSFDEYWRLFMRAVNQNPQIPPEGDIISPAVLRRSGSGVHHLMGLIDLTLKLQDKRVNVVWKYPEAHLHPSWQVGLADLLIALTARTEPAGEATKA